MTQCTIFTMKNGTEMTPTVMAFDRVFELAARLEAQGWVARSPHPTDRRATLVRLTERGTAAAARMHAERQESAATLLGDVAADELATFVALLDQVLDRIAQPAS